MTADELYAFLRTWMLTIVAVPVIRSHQDAPAPKGTYMVIEEGNWHPIGQADKMTHDPAEINPRRYDYQVPLALWEVGGRNDNLLALGEALETQDTLDAFSAVGLSVTQVGIIQDLPRLTDKKWERESRVDWTLLVARANSGDNNYIETIETDNNINTGG